jgi:hypothetical protein
MRWRGSERSQCEVSYDWVGRIPILDANFLVVVFSNLVNKK